MENYNLLLAERKILSLKVFGVEKSIGNVKFAVRRPRDRIRRHFLAEKHEFLKNDGLFGHVFVGKEI